VVVDGAPRAVLHALERVDAARDPDLLVDGLAPELAAAVDRVLRLDALLDRDGLLLLDAADEVGLAVVALGLLRLVDVDAEVRHHVVPAVLLVLVDAGDPDLLALPDRRAPRGVRDLHLEVLGEQDAVVEQRVALVEGRAAGVAWPGRRARVLLRAEVLHRHAQAAGVQVAAGADHRAVDGRGPLDRLGLVDRGVVGAVAVGLARRVVGAAEQDAADVVVLPAALLLQRGLRPVDEGDVEDDPGGQRLAGLVVQHVDHQLRAGRAGVLAVDRAVLLGGGALGEVGLRLLVAVAEDPLGVAAGVVVLLVARVQREPVRVVDVRLLVAGLGEVGDALHAGLDRDDEPVVDRQVDVDAVHVVPRRHGVRAEPELRLLLGARGLLHEALDLPVRAVERRHRRLRERGRREQRSGERGDDEKQQRPSCRHL
jgi:hypothetical protein